MAEPLTLPPYLLERFVAELLLELEGILGAAEPLLAQSLAEAIAAGFVQGGAAVARKLPPPPLPSREPPTPSPFFTLPPSPPPRTRGLLPPPGEGPTVRLPMTEAAAADLANRQVLTRADFDRLDVGARVQAFTVARLTSVQAVERVRDALAEDVARGGTLETFADRVEQTLGAGVLSPGNLESLYRTHVGTAALRGQEAVATQPLVRDEFPYRWEVSIEDSRRTELCKVITAGGLDGTGVYREDDPVWKRFRALRHWQCRCGTVVLSVEGAAQKGVREARRWLETGEAPEQPQHVPWPSVELPAGWTPGGT